MIALVAFAGVMLTLVLALSRLFAGPTLYDRALVSTSLILKAALACAAIGAMFGRPDTVDAALVLVLAAFVLNAGVLKFFRVHTFQPPMTRAEERS